MLHQWQTERIITAPLLLPLCLLNILFFISSFPLTALFMSFFFFYIYSCGSFCVRRLLQWFFSFLVYFPAFLSWYCHTFWILNFIVIKSICCHRQWEDGGEWSVKFLSSKFSFSDSNRYFYTHIFCTLPCITNKRSQMHTYLHTHVVRDRWGFNWQSQWSESLWPDPSISYSLLHKALWSGLEIPGKESETELGELCCQ